MFRAEEVSCAIELVDAALARAEGNTYEALVAVGDSPADGGGPAGSGGGQAQGTGGDTVLGYACFGATPMTDGTFDLYWLIVAAEARGRGIGAQLLRATEAELSGRGARLLRIETSSLEGQGGAARFYERSGYERVGNVADFYRPGDDLLTFAKRL